MNPEKIAIIIPCYNEALRLQQAKFLSFAAKHPYIDLWFVNDGSKDATLEVLQQISDASQNRIFTFDLGKNYGKSGAIRQAVNMLAAEKKYPYIGFIDADLSAPLGEIIPLAEKITADSLLIVAGARVKLLGKIIERSALRHYMGRIFATYYDSLLKLRNYDTQCGLKIFESTFAARIFQEPFVSNWFFDIELFLRARIALGHTQYNIQIAEIPLNEWKEVKGSKLKLSDFAKAPFEVLKIYRKYKEQNKGA